MAEPTNHRAEAEYWLTHAVDAYENAQPVDVVHAKALIGIGHALLALTEKPPMEPPADMTGFPGFEKDR